MKADQPKRAIFFAGWPPLSMSGGKVQVLLADQNEDVIDIPSLHIVGCNDPYISGAVALYNMCDRNCAEMFDHGKGHTVPRDSRTILELCDAIERLLSTGGQPSSFTGGMGELKAMGTVTV